MTARQDHRFGDNFPGEADSPALDDALEHFPAKHACGLDPRVGTGPPQKMRSNKENESGFRFAHFVLHRHPKLWSDPERFDPDRFASPAQMAPPYFIAFGAGGRACIGEQFAINEIMLVLSDIFQNLHLDIDRSRPIVSFFNGTLRPDPLRIRVSARMPP